MAVNKTAALALNQRIEEFLLERGAIKVGFATLETLAGGPPSVDLEYKLKGARSAISYAYPLKKECIRPFLGKKDRGAHEQDDWDTMAYTKALSWECAEMLVGEGYAARGTTPNLKFRKDVEGWQKLQYPDISHRYIAVRSGVGSFGWSGNVGIEGYGSTVILGTIVTTAELAATDPIPEKEGFCENCKLCLAACPGEMFEKDRSRSVTIGGVTFSYAERRDYARCGMYCGGATGLHSSGKWSTWSPGRFKLPKPEDDTPEELARVSRRAAESKERRPPLPGGTDSKVKLHADPDAVLPKVYLTCGNCQLVCWGDKKETAENVRILRNSGCVVQRPDGAIEILPPDEAEAEVNKMDPEQQALYR